MQKIGIIGGGFAGTMTAVHLIQNSLEPIEIFIINENETFNTGIAYNPYSKHQLLNVITAKMSAFADRPNHFLDWVMSNTDYIHQDENIVANAFMPRYIYGKYLIDIWKDAEAQAKSKGILVHVIHSNVENIENATPHFSIQLANGEVIQTDKCVIATGNQLPRNQRIVNTAFYTSSKYFQNPWNIDSVKGTQTERDVLIIGNGLTMVDTVLGLLEQGFKGNIYSISPNGFNILPHRHNGMKYTKLAEEIRDDMNLNDLMRLVFKHIKTVRSLGVSAEPIIDSLRPYTQNIWRRLSEKEKMTFMARLRHLWGVARHRIPLQIHDKIQQMRIDHKLHIYAGKIHNMEERMGRVNVEFLNKKMQELQTIQVDRVINCTGPETDISILENGFLRNLWNQGILSQDILKLGVNADLNTYEIINQEGKKIDGLYTIASNLKGLLWESTAVNELRTQAEKLAKNLLESTEVTA